MVSHDYILKVLKTASTAAIEDIYTFHLASIMLSQSSGFFLKEGFTQASL